MSDEKLVEEFGVWVPAGTVVFSQGDAGRSIYIVRSGRLRVLKQAHGNQRVIATLGAGEFFGEMAVIRGKNRSATVEAIEGSELLRIPADKFEQLLMREGEVAVRLLRKLTDRLDAANRLIDVLIESDQSARVILEVRRAMDESGPEVTFTPEEVALRLGLDTAVVAVALKRLLRVGVLDDAGGVIRVRDEERLEQFLGFLRDEGGTE